MRLSSEVVDDLAIELFRKERWAKGEAGSVKDLEAAWESLPSHVRATLKSESRQIIFNLLQAMGLTTDRKPLINPGDEFLAARGVIQKEIDDEPGFVATDLLHRVIDAVEEIRYKDVPPRPIVDRPEA